MKLGFNLIKKSDQLWVQILRSKYKWKGNLPIALHEGNASRLWKGIWSIWSTVREGVIWNIGNGVNVDFWRDKWVKDWGPLLDICTHPEYILDKHIPVKDMVTPSGEWNWSVISSILPSQAILSISAYKPPSTHDVDDFVGGYMIRRDCFS